jgi:hypothetical protein
MPDRSAGACCRASGKRGGPASDCIFAGSWRDCGEQRKKGAPMTLANERVAWFNGKILRESEVLIPFRDQGFTRGDAVFDMTRSFNGKAFRLEDHVARLYRSLRYLELDPGLSPGEMVAISTDVLDRNRHLLMAGEDYWLAQRISRGIHPVPRRQLGPLRPQCHHRVPAPAIARAGAAFPRRHRGSDPVFAPHSTRLAVAARQDASIPEPRPRRPRGEGA